MITFVSHTNKPGGAELALRRYLDATTQSVRLVTMEHGGVWDGLDIEVSVAQDLLALRSALRGGEVIVSNSMRAAFLTALVAPPKSRLVYWVRDGLTTSAMSPLALHLTKHVTARRVSHYIANSAWTAGTVREALSVAPDRIQVVHSMCGVTEDMLGRTPRKAPHTPARLLFLGRLSPWKAPDIAVRALTHVRRHRIEATLTIAGGTHFGEDRYAQSLYALVEAEPAATMVGHIKDVPGLLTEHDVLVHCSTAPEPFGQVIVQGLAAGMPVVATGHGGPVEILRGAPTELLYPPGDPAALASALAAALAKIPTLSSWATSRSAEFTDQRALRATDSALRAVGERHRQGVRRTSS
ncbi:glycosyltransferase [Ornithinimicrobium sp. F0845]|uniref:glycosyltransferase n=1 Tax=Ornithinimicrobium sp. F0845 TaxID=2926412 RepID=UPI001FF3609D|nr:glycosyltransferase [Ornithinimicrobium sp. F0845]MCK0110534.1 glycosyltransferase [Ornithinimicrobium sp. F0845]